MTDEDQQLVKALRLYAIEVLDGPGHTLVHQAADTIERLQKQIYELTMCPQDGELSRGMCRICDNDE